MELMKKFVLIMLVISLLSTMLTGCGDSDYQIPDVVISELGKKIYTAYVDKDAEAIKEMLSPKIQNRKKTDKEIEAFLNIIDGNIEGYKELRGSAGGGKIRDGEYVERTGSGSVHEITTDTGKTYMIGFVVCLKNVENPDEEGISLINIQQEEEDSDRMQLLGRIGKIE